MMSKKRFRIWLRRALSFSIIISFVFAMSTVALDVPDNDRWQTKISSELWAVMDAKGEDELISVTVWLDDTQVQNSVDATLKNEEGMDPQVYEDDEIFQSKIVPDIVQSVERAVGYEAAHAVFSQANTPAAERQDPTRNVSGTLPDTEEVQKARAEFEGVSLVEKAINAEIDRYIVTKRQLNKRECTALNENLIESMKSITDERIIFKSTYTPNILMNLTKEEIINLAHSDDVMDIDCYVNLEVEIQTATELPKVGVPYVRDILGYRGSASVSIGVIEVGRYSSSRSQLSSAHKSGRLVYRKNGSYSPSIDEHASNVVSLIVGPEGVVPNAHVFQTSAKDDATIRTALELLLNDNVRVINMSLGIYTTTYTDIDRFVDKFILDNNVACVVAAGNNSGGYGDGSTNVVSPGRAYNAITVGNANTLYGSGMHVSSSYTGNYKPDVAAPGCFYIPGSSNEGGAFSYDCGTSFAAPVVTGIVAQVIEAGTSSYKYNPIYLKSVIVTGSNGGAISSTFIGSPTDSTGGGSTYPDCPLMATRSGFGLVNAKKSVEISRSGRVMSISKYTGTTVAGGTSTRQLTKTVSVPSGKILRASFVPSLMPPVGQSIEYPLNVFGIRNSKSGAYFNRNYAGFTMASQTTASSSTAQNYVIYAIQRTNSSAGYITWDFI